jgi:RNA polymerase-binding transcription factor DksA
MSGHNFTELMDQAQEEQERSNRAALERIQSKAAPETHPDFDGKHCVECPTIIPIARRNLGKVRCVHCQTALEKRTTRR